MLPLSLVAPAARLITTFYKLLGILLCYRYTNEIYVKMKTKLPTICSHIESQILDYPNGFPALLKKGPSKV